MSRWQSLQSPIALAEAMWNHAGRMREEMARQNISWQRLSPQELTDILVYLRNLREMRGRPVRFQTIKHEGRRGLVCNKGCANCHKGELDLRERLRGRTLTDIAVAMWNHSPQMTGASQDIRARRNGAASQLHLGRSVLRRSRQSASWPQGLLRQIVHDLPLRFGKCA